MTFKPNRHARIAIINTIKKRDGYFCYICKQKFSAENLPTIDHYIPKAHGGTWQLENLRLAHNLCNSLKANLMPTDSLTNLCGWSKLPTSAYRRKPKNCPHSEKYYCWACFLGFEKRLD